MKNVLMEHIKKFKNIIIIMTISLLIGFVLGKYYSNEQNDEPVIAYNTTTIQFDKVSKAEVFNKEYIDMIDVSYKDSFFTKKCKVSYNAMVTAVYDLQNYQGKVNEHTQTITLSIPQVNYDITQLNVEVIDFIRGKEDGKSSIHVRKEIKQHVLEKIDQDEDLKLKSKESFQSFIKSQIQQHYTAYRNYTIVFK